MTSRRVALVVDSGAALAQQIDGGRAVVPMHVVVGDTNLDNSADGEVYVLLRRGEKATTSTPSPGDYLEAFEQLGGFEVDHLPDHPRALERDVRKRHGCGGDV